MHWFVAMGYSSSSFRSFVGFYWREFSSLLYLLGQIERRDFDGCYAPDQEHPLSLTVQVMRAAGPEGTAQVSGTLIGPSRNSCLVAEY